MLGQTIQIETMVKLALVAMFAVIMLILIMIISGSFGPLLEEICKQHPEWPWCEPTTSQINYETSMKSSVALTCAVNSVAQGSQWDGGFTVTEDEITETYDCSDFYTTTASLDDESDDENGMSETSIQCEEDEEFKLMGTIKIDIYIQDADDECKELYGSNTYAMAQEGWQEEKREESVVCNIDNTEECRNNCESLCEENDYSACNLLEDQCFGLDSEWSCPCEIYNLKEYQCWSKSLICTVNNFQLPQEVNKAEEYIRNFGDPQFLLYWSQFPIDEDTWTYTCLLYTSPSPRDATLSRMPSSA